MHLACGQWPLFYLAYIFPSPCVCSLINLTTFLSSLSISCCFSDPHCLIIRARRSFVPCSGCFCGIVLAFPVAAGLPQRSNLYSCKARKAVGRTRDSKHVGSKPQGQEGRHGQGRIDEESSGRRRQCGCGCGSAGRWEGAGGRGVGGPARRHASAEEGRGAGGRARQCETGADHPHQGEARRRHPRDLHQLAGVVRGAEEDGGGEDWAAPGRPEGDVQGQGEGLQGVPGHGRRQGPLQARRRRGPRGPRSAPHRGAPYRPPREGRQGRRRRHCRGRQARSQGVGAGCVGAEGGEGGGERRGAGDGAAHERAAQARCGGRRRRRQGPEADAGEARAEVRGDARRRDGQERHHQAQIQRKAGQAGAAAKAASATEAAAAAISPSVSAAAAAAAAAAGTDAVGDVRPAVVVAVDVVGLLDDHRQLHGVVRRTAGKSSRLDAVLMTANANAKSKRRMQQSLCTKNCTPCPEIQ